MFTNQDINGLLSGVAWATDSLTYSFPTSPTDYGSSYGDPAPAHGFMTLTAAQQAVVQYALGLISQYTPLTFTEITETTSTHATLRFADSSSPSTSYAYYPNAVSTGGDAFYGNIRFQTHDQGRLRLRHHSSRDRSHRRPEARPGGRRGARRPAGRPQLHRVVPDGLPRLYRFGP
ncbi:MAG: hypothetical protein WDM92_00305 [Caulobacteraceae bacterium]